MEEEDGRKTKIRARRTKRGKGRFVEGMKGGEGEESRKKRVGEEKGKRGRRKSLTCV